MALSSQMTRTGLSRRYHGSGGGRRKSRRWPLLVALVAAAGVVGAVQWWGGSGAEAVTPETAAAATQTTASQPQGPSRVAELPPMGATPAPQQPAVASISLGGPTASVTPAAVRPAAPEAANPSIPTAAPTYDASVASSPDASNAMRQGMTLIEDGRVVEGRRVLSGLLFGRTGPISPADAQTVRDTLNSVNKDLVFSSKVFPGDTVTEAYKVQPGDLMVKIGFRNKVPYQFLELINKTEARKLQAGRALKVVKGPFHARVIKSEYRMDLFLNDADGSPIYVTSLPVGLGESDSTPLGKWLIEPGRKVQNPNWANPRTGEYYQPNDPNNPIGEYWLALKGLDPGNESIKGYGIHGTNEPQSIGQQMSMGCVRLRDADIELVYKMLQDGESTVEIVR